MKNVVIAGGSLDFPKNMACFRQTLDQAVFKKDYHFVINDAGWRGFMTMVYVIIADARLKES